MSFSTLQKLLSIDKETYINALWVKHFKPTIFLLRLCKDIWTNPFAIHVGNLWQANTDVQFILDTYVVASYCTSYLTIINKTVTKKLKNIIISCNENKIETHTHIQKMGNDFLNAQQMSTQLTTYVVLFIPLYHAYRTFKFINTSPLQECAFLLKKCCINKNTSFGFYKYYVFVNHW
jgi:hypothetical protein